MDPLEQSVHDPESYMTQSFMGKTAYQYIESKNRYKVGYILIITTLFFWVLYAIFKTWFFKMATLSTFVIEIGNMTYIFRLNKRRELS